MYLVVGLGNPGPKYERNRHNIGFRVIDELARELAAWKAGMPGAETTSGMLALPAGLEPGAKGSLTRGSRGREKAVLVKPMEFMNLSGFAVQRTAKFHDVEPDHIVVIHDELDLDFGIVRLKQGGGHGGHNGLRSIMEQLGGGDFARVRMGIGRDPNKPPGSKDAASWVLSDFPSVQAAALTSVISAGCDAVKTVLALGITSAMNKHNARPSVI